MKLLGIAFCNLNSLRGEWSVRFDEAPLRDAGLFAITGPTGSGKSTLLDAVTLGLYGRVHRYGNTPSPEDIMTRHTGESWSRVDFAAGGERYRAEWSRHRARKKPDGKPQQARMELVRLSDGSILSETLKEVPAAVADLTGLDYPRFLRSVVLAQGDFAAFLKADEGERRELLEKVTGLEIYSAISAAAYQREKTEKAALDQLRDRLDSASLLDADERGAIETEARARAERLATLNRDIQTIRDQIAWRNRIAAMEAAVAEGETALAANAAAMTAMQDDRDRLARHRALDAHQSRYDKLALQAERLDDQTRERADLDDSIDRTGQERHEAAEAMNAAAERSERLAGEFAEREPRLRRAMALDSDIARQSTQAERQGIELDELGQAIAALTAEIDALEARHNEVQATLNETADWLDSHAGDAELPERLGEIRTATRRWIDQEEIVTGQRQRIAVTRGELADLDHQIAGLDADRSRLEEAAADLEKRLSDSGEAEDNLSELEQRRATVAERIADLDSRLHIARRYHQQACESTQLRERIHTIDSELKTTHAEADTLRSDAARTGQAIADLQRLVEQARRIAGYEAARGDLVDGEPCPLCGAVHHPWASAEPHPAIAADAARLAEQEKQREAIVARLDQLEREIVSGETRVADLRARDADLQDGLATAEREWQAAGHDLPIPPEADLNDERIPLLEERETLGARLERRRQSEADRRTLHEELELQQRQLADVRATLGERRARRETLAERLVQEEQALATAEHEHAARHEALSGELGDIATPPATVTEATHLLSDLEKRRRDLGERREQRDRLDQERATLRERLEDRRARLDREREREAAQREKLDRTRAELDRLVAERQELFDSDDPEAALDALSAERDAAREAAADTRERLAVLQQREADQAERRTALLERIAADTERFETARDTFLAGVAEQGIESLDAFRAARLDEAMVREIEERERRLERERDRLQGGLESRREELATLRSEARTEADLETLQKRESEREAEREQVTEERVALEARLRRDSELRAEQARLAEAITERESEYRRWARLSELIGSAGGERFSRFAQGLTLARLVQLANRHLERLNDRYRIRRQVPVDVPGRQSDPNYLELEIIDRYQADVVRPTQSLSGGESFLVSLALALGLSDLASHKHRIESLFIDEGFGTLDAETLDTAIATLENLQADGKTIGIISHVDALKERITTQIQLRKESGGLSRLRVVPAPATGG